MTAEDGFGYGYFDDPGGLGYRGYRRDGNGDGGYLPWTAARDFCVANQVTSAVDVGCAKGFLVAELLGAGIDAAGYDVSAYALSFAAGLPCYQADIRQGVPRAPRRSSRSGCCCTSTKRNCRASWPACAAARPVSCCSPVTTRETSRTCPTRCAASPGHTPGGGECSPAAASASATEESALTSTRPYRRPVYLEFPDFGYGPASALLSLVRPVIGDYDWHVVSTGSASAFALAQLPGATPHELDTFPSSNWPRFANVAPPGAMVVSATNPGFAAWALENGYRVGAVDTLRWMWDVPGPALAHAAFHIVQFYFGSTAPAGAGGRGHVRPIVDAALWPTTERRAPVPGTAVIGLGGMHLPGADDMVADYVRWLLAAVLPQLIRDAGSQSVTIAGGRPDLASLVPGPWSAHPAVHVRTGLTQAEYAKTVRSAEHLVCSPGLASIYECAAAVWRHCGSLGSA